MTEWISGIETGSLICIREPVLRCLYQNTQVCKYNNLKEAFCNLLTGYQNISFFGMIG